MNEAYSDTAAMTGTRITDAEMDAVLERAYRRRATVEDVAVIREYWAKRWSCGCKKGV
jgi:hypothetical protein